MRRGKIDSDDDDDPALQAALHEAIAYADAHPEEIYRERQSRRPAAIYQPGTLSDAPAGA